MMNYPTRVAHFRDSFAVFALVPVLFLITGIGATVAVADDVVVPNAYEFVEGPSANCIPVTGCLDTDRYQQVYDSSDFSSQTGIGPRYITEIRFRPNGLDPNNPAPPFMDAVFSDIEINLSTTPTLFGPDGVTAIGPDNLFATFDMNTGGDVVNVYRGALTLSSANTGPAAGPKDFDIVITLQTPFLYDPALGHLLFEWKNHGGETDFDGFPDAVSITGDSTSRVESANDPSDPNAVTGLPDSTGLITQFTFTDPNDVGATEVPTPVGVNVPVIDLNEFFEQVAAKVVVAGTTSADFCVAPDARQIKTRRGRDRFVYRYLHVAEFSGMGSCTGPVIEGEPETWEDVLTQINLRIPPRYRSYFGEYTLPGETTPTEGFWLVLAVIRGTAEYDGPVVVESYPETLIDYSNTVLAKSPGCDRPLRYRNLDLSGAVDAFGEWQNVEGDTMIVETAQCNRSRSMTRRTTHVYPMRQAGVFQRWTDRIDLTLKFAGIQNTLGEAAACADPALITDMQTSLNSAWLANLYRRYDEAEEHLEQLARFAKETTTGFDTCSISANYRGNFMGRSLTAAFTVHDRFQHRDVFVKYLVPADLDVPLLEPEFGPPIP